MFTLNVMDMTGVTTVLHVQPTFTVKHIKSQLAKTIGLEPAVINLAIDRRAEEGHVEDLGGALLDNHIDPETPTFLTNRLTLQKCGLSKIKNDVLLVISGPNLDQYASMSTWSEKSSNKKAKILVVGSASCGKSSLLKCFTTNGRHAIFLWRMCL
jgi:hypothetical protein